jgi:hypothetical protein
MPSLFDKLMEKSVKESEQTFTPVEHTPQVDSARQHESLQAGKEENKQRSLQVKRKTSKEENQQTSKPASRQTPKPANRQALFPVNLQTGNQVVVRKYTSYLTPECIRGLKRLALESDRKDYEVLIEIVTQYLENQK